MVIDYKLPGFVSYPVIIKPRYLSTPSGGVLEKDFEFWFYRLFPDLQKFDADREEEKLMEEINEELRVLKVNEKMRVEMEAMEKLAEKP